MASLPYFAADTLGMTLHQVGDGFKAHEVHLLPLGPWRMELPIEVESDIIGPTELSFWVTLGGSLRLYLVVREQTSWLLVLDRQALSACERVSRTAKGRVDELKPAILGAFWWTNGEWSYVAYDGRGKADAVRMVQDGSSQSPENARARAPQRPESPRSRRL